MSPSSWTLLTQVAYLVTALPAAVWLARTLHRGGAAFLVDVLRGRADLAASVNRLLVVGFGLLELGFVLLLLRAAGTVSGAGDAIVTLSTQLGVVLLVLGAVHLVNLAVLASVRRSHTEAERRYAFSGRPHPHPGHPGQPAYAPFPAGGR